MDNPEKLATLGKQDKGQIQTNTTNTPLYANKHK